MIKELWHNPSRTIETLDIDSVACIDESDKELYDSSTTKSRQKWRFRFVPIVGYRGLDKAANGTKPFVIRRRHTIMNWLSG